MKNKTVDRITDRLMGYEIDLWVLGREQWKKRKIGDHYWNGEIVALRSVPSSVQDYWREYLIRTSQPANNVFEIVFRRC